jgi:hypothetical protein
LNQVSPIALQCETKADGSCKSFADYPDYPWADDTTEHTFAFTPGQPTASTFGGVALPGMDPTDYSAFANYMTCDPTVAASSTCDQQNVQSSPDASAACMPASNSPPCWYPHMSFTPTELLTALQGAQGSPHLVAIYDTVQPDVANRWYYHVVGWAYASFDNVPSAPNSDGSFNVDVSFHTLMLNSSYLSSDGDSGSREDFGVRGLGLGPICNNAACTP